MAKTIGGVRGKNSIYNLKYTEIRGIKLSDPVVLSVKGSAKDKEGNVFYSPEGVNNLLSELGDKWRLMTTNELYSLNLKNSSEWEKAGFHFNGYGERENGKLTLKLKKRTADYWINDAGDLTRAKVYRIGPGDIVLYDAGDSFCQIRLVKNIN